MIKMHVKTGQAGSKDYFLIYADEPVRVDVYRFEDQHLIAHAYRGVEDNQNDDPVGAYDSWVNENKSWQYPPPEDVNLSDVLAELRRAVDKNEDPTPKIKAAELLIEKQYPHFDIKIMEVFRNRLRSLRLQFKRTAMSYVVPIDLSSLRGSDAIAMAFDEIEELSGEGHVEVIKSRYA